MFVCPLDTERELDMQQDVRKSSRVVSGMFCVRSECGCSKGRYMYLVLIVDVNWLLL